MQETAFPQVRAASHHAMRTPDELMAEIDKCQKYLDEAPAGASTYYRQVVLGRIRVLEWVLSGD